MAERPNGFPKVKFNRKYMAYNPERYMGPQTEILDTVLKPLPPKEDNG